MREPLALPDKFIEFLAHWRALQGTARMPTLADFLDRPIPGLQPWVVIFDLGEDVICRLLGTALANFYGIDFTGNSASAVYAPVGLELIRRTHALMVERSCGSLSLSSGTTSAGRFTEMLTMGLPLSRRHETSVVWLVEPSMTAMGETGMPGRRLTKHEWIDLGHGVPG